MNSLPQVALTAEELPGPWRRSWERLQPRKQPVGIQRPWHTPNSRMNSLPQVPPTADPGRDVVISNTGYWMGPDITVARASKGKVRAFGRVWDFDGRSAEICQIDWSGPA